MVFKYSNRNTCIRSNNLNLIAQVITSILEQEGYCLIPQPALPKNGLPVMEVLCSLPWKVAPYLWLVGLFPVNLGWTIVTTEPSDLLCKRARGAVRPRLSELAIQSGCDAFHYMTYADPSGWGALLEANASGQTFVSGCLDCADEKDMKFCDEPVTELSGGLHFFLLDVPEEIRAAGNVNINYEERERRKKELAILMRQERADAAEALAKYEAEWEELDKSSFQIADERLGRTLVAPERYWDYWYHHNLYYRAYADSQQLKADRVRLLYFQSAKALKEVAAKGIWETICEGVDTSPWSPDNIPF